jgi:hypothetical protein
MVPVLGLNAFREISIDFDNHTTCLLSENQHLALGAIIPTTSQKHRNSALRLWLLCC